MRVGTDKILGASLTAFMPSVRAPALVPMGVSIRLGCCRAGLLAGYAICWRSINGRFGRKRIVFNPSGSHRRNLGDSFAVVGVEAV